MVDNIVHKGDFAKHVRYTPDICPLIVDLMAKGLTPIQVAAKLHISKDRFIDWASSAAYADFREAVKIGLTLCEAYWIEKGQQGMLGELDKFKEATYKLYMAHNFNWAEKSEQKIESTTRVLSDEELENKIKVYLETIKNDGNSGN